MATACPEAIASAPLPAFRRWRSTSGRQVRDDCPACAIGPVVQPNTQTTEQEANATGGRAPKRNGQPLSYPEWCDEVTPVTSKVERQWQHACGCRGMVLRLANWRSEMFSVMYTGIGAIALLYLLVLVAVPFLFVLLAVSHLTKHCVRLVFRRTNPQTWPHLIEGGR